MHKKIWKILPGVLLAFLICKSSVQNANAYFTTYVTAKGGYQVSWSHREEIKEEYRDWSKYITIISKEGSVPVYVRVKAFAGQEYTLVYEGNDWEYNDKDGYCYYKGILQGGESVTGLRVGIDNIPLNPKDGSEFNVVVIYETIPVTYTEDGSIISPMDADWGKKSVLQEETGNEEKE